MKRIFRSKRRQTKRGKKNKKSEEKDTSAFIFHQKFVSSLCDSSFFSSACRDEENENENENENDDDDESSSGGVILCQY